MAEPAAHRLRAILITTAVALSLIYGFGLYAIFKLLHPISGLTGLAFLIGVPIAAPSLAVLIADPRGAMQIHNHIAIGAVSILAMLIAGFFVLHEVGICLVMASPLFVLFGLGGAALTGALLRYRRTRLMSLALIFLPIAGLSAEPAIDYPAQTNEVTTSVVIDAPVNTVWKSLVEVRGIQPNELGWTFTQDFAGVPKPLDAQLTGNGKGAVRHVAWERGIRFEEKITSWQKGRFLAWNFDFWPGSIPKEIEGNVRINSPYLKILNGSYTLAPLSANRTRVALQTRYWIKTGLNPYCTFWGLIFVNDFHSNVLHVIGERAERNRQSA